MNIYVGNLSYDVTDAELRNAFSQYGRVKSAKVVNDNMTGRSRGFGFVEMETDDEGRVAIAEMNGKDLLGRAVVVNEARPREERPRTGGGGGGGGGRFGGDRGDRGGDRGWQGGGGGGGGRDRGGRGGRF